MIMLNGMSNLKFEAQIYQIAKKSYILLFIYLFILSLNGLYILQID